MGEHSQRPKDTHHRTNRRNSKDHNRHNPIMVNANKHRQFHAFFGAMNAYEIAKCLNDFWIDPAYFLVVEKRRIE